MAVGLWAGLVIGFVTEYYTSNAYRCIHFQSFVFLALIYILLEASDYMNFHWL